jgi:hypothetical protein
MPPLAATPVPPPPAPAPVRSRVPLLLGIGIVLALVLAGVFVLWGLPLLRDRPAEEQQPTMLSPLASFPKLGTIFVRPDTDATHVWLIGRAGTVMRYELASGAVEDYTPRIPGIEDKTLTDVARVGDLLLIAYQGGIIEYGLASGEAKTYTEAEGLVSGSNLHLFPDPVDADTVWVSTFEGLSKLSLTSGPKEKYVGEMGILGTAIQPRVFHVDERYVWAYINANAYTQGGVARLDKRAGVWKSWAHDRFGNTGEY